MDAIQGLRQEAQQYGYLQSGPQMQVVNDGGYIDIEPVGGFMYVPVYDPYVVFARPRPGFFVGGAIRFGGGFHWVNGYNRFNWRNHEVVVNRRVWTAPVHRVYAPQRQFEQQRFNGNGRNFGGNREWNRNNAAPAMQPPVQRNFAPAAQPPVQRNFVPQQQQQRRDFGRQFPQQRNFAAPQQRNFTPAPRPMEQRNFTPQGRGQGFQHGGEGRGRGR
jgi:hypothetical protein